MNLVLDGLAVQGCDLDPVRLQGDHFAVVQINDLGNLRDDRGHVAGDEVLAVAHADDQRAAVACGVKRVGVIERQDSQRVSAARAFQGPSNGVFKRCRAGLEFRLDQVGDDFRIGLRLEFVPLGLQFEPEFVVVLDDPVVNDGNAACTVHVRMRIGFGWRAMSGPAGVPDPRGAADGPGFQRKVKVCQLADGFPPVQRAVLQYGNACRVITAVFQALQPLHEKRNAVTRTGVTYNAAHIRVLQPEILAIWPIPHKVMLDSDFGQKSNGPAFGRGRSMRSSCF